MNQETMTLRRGDDGIVYQVVTTTQANEIPLVLDELKRQAEQIGNALLDIQKKIKAVQDFTDTNDESIIVDVSTLADAETPVVNDDVLQQIIAPENGGNQ